MRVEVLPGLFYTLTSNCIVCESVQEFTPTHFNVDNYAALAGTCDQCGTAYKWTSQSILLQSVQYSEMIPAIEPTMKITMTASEPPENKGNIQELPVYEVPRMDPVIKHLKEISEAIGVPVRIFTGCPDTLSAAVHKQMQEEEKQRNKLRIERARLYWDKFKVNSGNVS